MTRSAGLSPARLKRRSYSSSSVRSKLMLAQRGVQVVDDVAVLEHATQSSQHGKKAHGSRTEHR